MEISLVPPAQVAAVWPKVSTFVGECLAAGLDELYGEWDLKRNCIDARMSLWVAHEADGIAAFAITSLQEFPKRRGLLVVCCGGRGVREWVEQLQGALEVYARQFGCAHLEAWDRRGWLRLCGGTEVSRVMRKELV